MAEYIEREAFLKWAREFYQNDKVFASAIINAPPADVAPVVHGYWIPCFDDEGRWRQGFAQCSNCGQERYACTIRNVNCCPNCGAMMYGGAENAGKEM